MRSMQSLFVLAFALAYHPQARAQEVISIWGETTPPFYKATTLKEYEAECWGMVCAYQVVEPSLTLFMAKGESSKAAVIILPGGGYETQAVYHEGYEIAEELSQRGVTAAVLKYRLPNPQSATQPQWVPSADVRQALSLLRARKTELGIQADLIGVLGFSAGSHLAAQVSVHPDVDADLNPDFSMLIYGVSRMNDENRSWLETTLYHRPLTVDEVAYQALIDHVDSNTPPAFLVHARDDEICHYSESTLYSEALSHHGVVSELHLFAHGGHGFGAGRDSDGTDQWLDLATNWLGRLP